MEYQEYVKQVGSFPTGIHTRINTKYRISSIYRKYANPFFEEWGWETFLWYNDKIEREYEVKNSSEEVINLHIEILDNFNN